MLPSIETIVENFDFIDDDDMRLEYLIELGRALPPMPDALRTNRNQVLGCQSQVWISSDLSASSEQSRLTLQGFSDSVIVCGFVALMIAFYEGKKPQEAAEMDGIALFRQLHFGSHVTSKRSNGVREMVKRIRFDAAKLAS